MRLSCEGSSDRDRDRERGSGVASHESQSQSCSQGLGSSAVEGTPRLTQGRSKRWTSRRRTRRLRPWRAICKPLSERVACRGALQVVHTAFPATVAMPMDVENGQPMQIDLATPRACQAEPQGSAQAPDPAAVFTWSEEKLLEPGDANHQAPAAGPEAKDVHNNQEAVAT